VLYRVLQQHLAASCTTPRKREMRIPADPIAHSGRTRSPIPVDSIA
jgi:hypothetical protein